MLDFILVFGFIYAMVRIIGSLDKKFWLYFFAFLLSPIILINLAIKEPKRAWLYLLTDALLLLLLYLMIFHP